MNPTLAPQAYKESAILTAPPERLVVMLYDGIRRFLYQATVAMREGNIEQSNNRMQRAEAIIDELLVAVAHAPAIWRHASPTLSRIFEASSIISGLRLMRACMRWRLLKT